MPQGASVDMFCAVNHYCNSPTTPAEMPKMTQATMTINMKTIKSNNGFTLIEILIVVAIIGILSALAYPQYGQFVEKSRRSDGHLALLQEIQTMERCKSTRYSYAGCALTAAESPEAYYAITLVSDATTFTITATGQNSQANDASCSVMTLDHRGEKTPDPDTTDCWPN